MSTKPRTATLDAAGELEAAPAPRWRRPEMSESGMGMVERVARGMALRLAADEKYWPDWELPARAAIETMLNGSSLPKLMDLYARVHDELEQGALWESIDNGFRDGEKVSYDAWQAYMQQSIINGVRSLLWSAALSGEEGK